eukprot:gene57961-biopygen51883
MLSIIKSYPDGMEARVRCDGGLSEPFAVRRGVRQGCILAPLLMNCFYAAVMSDWRRLVPAGVTIRFNIDGHLHNRTRAYPGRIYADDTTLLASSWSTSQLQWHRYQQVCGKWGLTISYIKTKHMVAGNDNTCGESLNVPEGQPALENVSKFQLLGRVTSKDGTYGAEVSHRLSSAGHMLHRLIPTVFKSKCLQPIDNFEELTDPVNLRWAGHRGTPDVARMTPDRLPLQTMFGYVEEWGRSDSANLFRHRVKDALFNYSIPVVDWYRLAQERDGWRSRIHSKWHNDHSVHNHALPPGTLGPGGNIGWLCTTANMSRALCCNAHGVPVVSKQQRR